jgi:pilus assembly protein CpaB
LVLAVVLLAAGTLVALTATSPPRSGPALVATGDLAAGATVRAEDVAVASRPAAELPRGVLTAVDVAVGHRAVSRIARGEVLTADRLAPHGLLSGVGAGRALATVSVAPDRVGVVAVGDAVRVVAAARDVSPVDPAAGQVEPQTLSDDARVLAVWPAPTDADPATVVLDVDVGSASDLAALPADLLVGLVIVAA